MPRQNQEISKLVPLRRFVIPGLYELPYLSLLVQRNKLKAQKIGRNYSTTKEWFDEYLELHACEIKRAAYRKKERKLEKNLRSACGRHAVNRQITFSFKTAITSLAVFLLLMAGIIFLLEHDREPGQVAGESEIFTGSAPAANVSSRHSD